MEKAINYLSLIFGILGLFYAIYNTYQFSKGIKINTLRSIRTLINRMEEEKQKYSEDSPQRAAMHHTQQDLDTLFRNLQTLFNISDNKAA